MQGSLASSEAASVRCEVSVVCTTYNHRAYLKEALDGFVSQETTFPFEIIIHDDASTDGTQELILEYAERFPSLIRPILQQENQYSKGGFKPALFASGYACGNFIALCEGDDYWLDSKKLQIQYDLMTANPGAFLCFHDALLQTNANVSGRFGVYQKPEYSTLDVLKNMGGFAATPTYFFRKQLLDELPPWVPEYAPVTDFFLELYATRRHDLLYIDRPMAVYRVEATGSWTAILKSDMSRLEEFTNAFIDCLSRVELDFSSFKSEIDKQKSLRWLRLAIAQLVHRDYQGFTDAIERSVEMCRYLSYRQFWLHSLRRFPLALVALAHFRGVIKRRIR